MLKLTRGSVYKMIERGTLPAIEVGEHIYVLKADVLAWDQQATRSR